MGGGMTPSKFALWVANRFLSPADALAEYFDDAVMAAASVGAQLEYLPILDNTWHYLPNLKGSDQQKHSYRGEYVTDADGTTWPAVTFTGLGKDSVFWKARDLAYQQWQADRAETPRSPDRAAEYQARAAELRAASEAGKISAEAQRKAGHEAAAEAVATAWADAEPCSEHPYLTSKRVQAHGLRKARANMRARLWNNEKREWQNVFAVRKGDLLVPMVDSAGKLWNVQRIDADGRKRFVMGGRKKGTFHRIDGTAPAWIAEGYATAATVHAATGASVVVAFDAGNLAEVARQLPDQVSAVAADNDANGAGRKGAEATGLPCAMPPTVGDDWNDYAARRSVDEVGQLLSTALAPVPASHNAPSLFDQVSDVHQLPPVPLMTWPHTSSNGQPLNTIPNLEHLLANYGFTVRYDVIRKDLVIRYPGQCGTVDNQRSKAVDTVLSLAALNRLPKSDTPSFLLSIGDDNAFNPVMDFIQSKPWDGQSRFAELLDTIQTRPGYDRDLLAILLRRWLVSAVAAAAKPFGFWSKGVLVFQGDQSIGKTAWIRALVPDELRDLVKIDATINPDNKDSIISAVSHWLVELGELDGTLRKADIARLKGFISQDVDQFRRPYGRTEEKFQRRTVFFASVNPEQFLADDTGNVRWWTVPVVSVNYQHGIDMQQLWAEAFSWYQAGERWWLDRGEEAQLEGVNAEHQQTDPVQELIQSRYGSAPADAIRRPMTATDILLEIGFDRPTQRQKNDAGQALRQLFGAPRRTKSGLLFDVPVLVAGRPC